MKVPILKSKRGLTLVELAVAMAVFALMLFLITQGFLGIIRAHQSGVASRNTQQNARLAIEQIVREGRSASDVRVLGSAPNQTVCLILAGGLVEYRVVGGRLYRATVDFNDGFDLVTNTCKTTVPFATNVPVTSTDVFVVEFVATRTPAPPPAGSPVTPPSLNVSMRLSTSDLSQLDAAHTRCLEGAGSQFCSVTQFSSTVSLRGTP
jgi:prepilin-type N-terminal cleavage/methylation domain-containing protein